MIAAPIPADETQRLSDLYTLDLLDTPPEERFDRITRLLTLVMKVLMAFISLVDADRQWFKSACGLSEKETPRSVSFCGHAILSDEALVVPDATDDVRFRDSPLVTGNPFIRFYAGHPLHGPGGHKVGSLCIADRMPRTPSGGELEALSEMARLVEREMGLVETLQLQRDLIASQSLLLHELSQAAKYVRSILPEPLEGVVRTRWRFEPSTGLGGDFFGYDWIDPNHFAVYLLDVSGHGVGAALLSVSVANTLRARSLPDTNFLDPADVLTRLNEAFPMERHDEKYFTIWYGVFNRTTRSLTWACGGHPPALLLTSPSPESIESIELGGSGLGIGLFDWAKYVNGTVDIGPSARLAIFSDGVYEVHKSDGSVMPLGELTHYLASAPGLISPDHVWDYIQEVSASERLADDFSFLEVQFS